MHSAVFGYTAFWNSLHSAVSASDVPEIGIPDVPQLLPTAFPKLGYAAVSGALRLGISYNRQFLADCFQEIDAFCSLDTRFGEITSTKHLLPPAFQELVHSAVLLHCV